MSLITVAKVVDAEATSGPVDKHYRYYVVEHYASADGPRIRVSAHFSQRETAIEHARVLITRLRKGEKLK